MCTLSKYIGIPFEDLGRTPQGFDCFGIIQYFYQQEFGLRLPDVLGLYTSANEPQEVKDAVQFYDGVASVEEVTGTYQDYDVLVFKLCGVETHVGMITNAERHEMLHLFFGGNSVIERYDYPKWQKRISRAFRHVTNI